MTGSIDWLFAKPHSLVSRAVQNRRGVIEIGFAAIIIDRE